MAKHPSYTAKTLKKLRGDGYRADVVERKIHGYIKNDYLGIIDIIGIKPGKIIGIQSTSYNAATKHRKIIRASENLKLWKDAGARFELWLWRKPKHRWEVIIEEY
jgi:hypothetical protein